jgi:formate dehydrogenase subunit gamma
VDLFRVSRNVWGQEVLQGVSWDLLWVFFGAGLAFILLHALYRRLLAPKRH